jgi:phage-related protein
MGLLWEIREYPAGVVTSTLRAYEQSDPELCAEYKVFLRKLAEYGSNLRMPYSRHVGDQFFELRPKSDQVALRILYYFSPTETKVAVFVHIFVKEKEQLPQADREIAIRRRKEREEQLKKDKQKSKKKDHGKRWTSGNGTYH